MTETEAVPFLSFLFAVIKYSMNFKGHVGGVSGVLLENCIELLSEALLLKEHWLLLCFSHIWKSTSLVIKKEGSITLLMVNLLQSPYNLSGSCPGIVDFMWLSAFRSPQLSFLPIVDKLKFSVYRSESRGFFPKVLIILKRTEHYKQHCCTVLNHGLRDWRQVDMQQSFTHKDKIKMLVNFIIFHNLGVKTFLNTIQNISGEKCKASI